jgi:nucleotide-binding universal stress UspA family protein
MSHTVTVGLDASAESRSAVDWAAQEAAGSGATLEIVQVRGTGAYPDSEEDRAEKDYSDRITAQATDDLARRHPELRVHSQRLYGLAPEVLVDASADSEMLVLGSRGMGSLLGHLVGSVALPTVARSRCPVVLVRAESGRHGAGAAHRTGDLVLGMPLDHPADELLGFGFDMAARRSAPLRVLHGWSLGAAYDAQLDALAADMNGGEGRAKAEELADRVRPWREKYPGVEVDLQVTHGQPARMLVDAATDAAMVMVGRRGRHRGDGGHLGSVAHAVMHHVTAPVAVVPHD